MHCKNKLHFKNIYNKTPTIDLKMHSVSVTIISNFFLIVVAINNANNKVQIIKGLFVTGAVLCVSGVVLCRIGAVLCVTGAVLCGTGAVLCVIGA